MSRPKTPSFRSPLGRARGLGSAHDGTPHWWAQRVSAVALLPLFVWFVGSLVMLSGSDYQAVTGWLGRPVPAIAMILLLIATFWHAALGCQVVIEDYVAGEGAKLAAITAVNLLCFALAVAGIFAVAALALA